MRRISSSKGAVTSRYLWLLLAVLAACATGCVVNPVPTPSSAGELSGQDTTSAGDASQGGSDLTSGVDTAASDTSWPDAQADVGVDSAPDSAPDAESDADSNVDPDALPDAASDTSGAVECCPLDPPGCDCVYTGGTKGPQGCMKLCDAAPVGWKKLVDANGCPYWQAGPQSCMVLPVKCDGNPPTFPSFTKVCSEDADCGFVVHQTDCCGNTTATGAWIEVVPAFESAENTCRSQYPQCKCAQGPTQAEVGDPPASGKFEVHCVKGQCLTSAAP